MDLSETYNILFKGLGADIKLHYFHFPNWKKNKIKRLTTTGILCGIFTSDSLIGILDIGINLSEVSWYIESTYNFRFQNFIVNYCVIVATWNIFSTLLQMGLKWMTSKLSSFYHLVLYFLKIVRILLNTKYN